MYDGKQTSNRYWAKYFVDSESLSYFYKQTRKRKKSKTASFPLEKQKFKAENAK